MALKALVGLSKSKSNQNYSSNKHIQSPIQFNSTFISFRIFPNILPDTKPALCFRISTAIIDTPSCQLIRSSVCSRIRSMSINRRCCFFNNTDSAFKISTSMHFMFKDILRGPLSPPPFQALVRSHSIVRNIKHFYCHLINVTGDFAKIIDFRIGVFSYIRVFESVWVVGVYDVIARSILTPVHEWRLCRVPFHDFQAFHCLLLCARLS